MQAADGPAPARRRRPRRPTSAPTRSRQPTRHVACLRCLGRVPEARDRGRATVGRSERGASPPRRCPQRYGTAGGTSRHPVRHRPRRIALQLPRVPQGRPLEIGPPRRPAPTTRRPSVRPNAEPARGRRQAGDDGTRAPQAQGKRQQRRTSPRPARSQSAGPCPPARRYSCDELRWGGRRRVMRTQHLPSTCVVGVSSTIRFVSVDLCGADGRSHRPRRAGPEGRAPTSASHPQSCLPGSTTTDDPRSVDDPSVRTFIPAG